MLQDHDGDCRSAAARVPLHRSESHREGADTLNGAERPGRGRGTGESTLRSRHGQASRLALSRSSSDILLQVNVNTISRGEGNQLEI